MYRYQELSLGGGRIALGLPRLLITRPPSRPKGFLSNLHACESPFDDWVQAALGPRYKPSMNRLVHTTALMTIHYSVGIIDSGVDDPE